MSDAGCALQQHGVTSLLPPTTYHTNHTWRAGSRRGSEGGASRQGRRQRRAGDASRSRRSICLQTRRRALAQQTQRNPALEVKVYIVFSASDKSSGVLAHVGSSRSGN
jgi:hypothetical protein